MTDQPQLEKTEQNLPSNAPKLTRREFLKVSALFGSAVAVLAACGGDGMGTDLGNLPENERKPLEAIEDFEKKFNSDNKNPIFPNNEGTNTKTSKQNFEKLAGSNDSIKVIDYKDVYDPETYSLKVSGISDVRKESIIVPALQFIQQPGFSEFLIPDSRNIAAQIQWDKVAHWMHNAPDAGYSVYDVANYGRFVQGIVKGALDGEGMILRRPETVTESGNKLQEAYMFVRSYGQQQWVTILSKNGAPITNFDSALKDNKDSIPQAARAIRSLLKTAEEIKASDVPDDIVKNWKDSPPPVIRYLAWLTQYKVTQLALQAGISVKEAISKVGAFVGNMETPLLIVPAGAFDCDDALQKYCRPENIKG